MALVTSGCGWLGPGDPDQGEELGQTGWAYREEVDPLTDDQLSLATRLVRSGPYAFEIQFSCRNRRVATYQFTALDPAGTAVPLYVRTDYLTGVETASVTVRADLKPARSADYVIDRFDNVLLLSGANLGREGLAEMLAARTVMIGFKLADGDAVVPVDQASSALQRAIRQCPGATLTAEPTPAQPATSPPVAPEPPVPAKTHRESHSDSQLPERAAARHEAASNRPQPVRATAAQPAARHEASTTARRLPAQTRAQSNAANTSSSGPSFSCSARLTRVESLICGNAELARLDRRMAALYGQVRANRHLRQRVLRDQRLFLADVAQCQTVRCVNASYSNRIGELANY